RRCRTTSSRPRSSKRSPPISARCRARDGSARCASRSNIANDYQSQYCRLMLRISDLAYGEQLVLWAARRWLADRSGWPRVAEEFALALGCIRARAALGALERILEALHGHARRTVYLHRLDCCLVSGD